MIQWISLGVVIAGGIFVLSIASYFLVKAGRSGWLRANQLYSKEENNESQKSRKTE